MIILKNAYYMLLMAIFTFGLLTFPREVNAAPAVYFTSFRDVPGVTEEEIIAIELLIEQHDYFIYGMLKNDEAFYTINGEITGFAARMTGWLTELFGIPFIPAIFEWTELIDGLESGEIDFTGQLTRTEERTLIYTMTDPIAKRTLDTVRVKDAEPLSDIIQKRSPSFVFYTGTVTEIVLASSGVFDDFEAIHVDHPEEVIELLKSEEADAFIGDGVMSLSIDFPDFYVEPIYPFVFGFTSFSARNTDFSPIVNVVQKVLENGGMSILAELYALGREDFIRHRVSVLLSEEEWLFIENNPVIRVAANSLSYPFGFFNTWKGEFQGISHDILREVEISTGLRFEIIEQEFTDTDEVLRSVEEGQAHLGISVIRPAEELQDRLLFSNNFFKGQYALLSHIGFPNISINEVLYLRVGVVENSIYEELFNSIFPEHLNLMLYAHMDYTVRALEAGEIDMIFSSLHGVLHFTNFLERTGIRANIIFDESYYISFAINQDMYLLSSIINHVIDVIDISLISDDWMGRTFDYSLRLLEAQRPYFISALFFLFVALILLGILLKQISKERQSLEKLVEERTHDLKVASDAKTEFLANMSHELRTPMNSIMGFSELALEHEMDDKIRVYLEKITENSHSLLQIINDILDVSKIETGKIELKYVPFDLDDIFDRCYSIILPEAKEKNLELFFHIDPIPYDNLLLGDPVRLHQVFINLISNAVKFTDKGQIKVVSAIVSCIEENKVTIFCEIQDSGIGMSRKQIAQVFEPFTQADSSMTRKHGGTGLGLPIVKNFLKLMGSDLKVESNLGIGTKFSFELTFDTVKTSKTILEHNNILNLEKPYFNGEVLVCEDNEVNQMVITEHLEQIGLKFVIAENGQIGIDIIKERMESGKPPFDLIFMDMHMPVMDGLLATKNIIAMGYNTPIIALTANIMFGSSEMYRQRGVKDCIGKPFMSQELWACILKYLEPVERSNDFGRKELLIELQSLLKTKNGDCLDLLPKLRLIPEAEELADQIEALDFKEALETLLKLKTMI